MTAQMKILGWKAKGLRCPDHTIDLIQKQNSPYAVSLIQMPNGTGKTTTLALLRAALSGEPFLSGEDANEFAKKNSGIENGIFEVKLLLNGRQFTMVLEFDFIENSINYKTTVPGHGQRLGFEPPADFRNFMKGEFVNFFVFDGELADHLLDKEYTDAEVVVERLFQVDLLRKIADRVDIYWDYQTKDASAKKQHGKTLRSNRVKKLRAKLKQLERNHNNLSKEYLKVIDQVNKTNQEYKNEIAKSKDLSVKFAEAQDAFDSADIDVKQKAREILEIIAHPHALSGEFAGNLLALKQGLDRVKLPESAAREFFVELAEEVECVCGRTIDDDIRKIILQRADSYLASDEVSMLNSMKTDIVEALTDENEFNEALLNRQIQELQSLNLIALNAKGDLEYIKAEVDGIDPEAKRVRGELERLQERQKEIEIELSQLNADEPIDSDDSSSIVVIKRLLQIAEEELEKVTKTINLGKKRDLLKEILENAFQEARSNISIDICGEANNKIEMLMPNNNIRIEIIDKCLVLRGQSGGSAGEQLSIAYAFLSTLFSRSDHTLPFIVDSPAGPIDLAIRPKIGRLIPHLTDQFVAFTISSERDKFVPALKNSSKDSMQYLTVFKSGNSELEKLAKKESLCTQTQDGFVVTGEKFFNDFQIDEE